MRKKLLLFLLGVLTMLPTFAQDFEYTFGGQTLTYSVVDEGEKTCSVIGHNGMTNSFIIPETVEYGGEQYVVSDIELSGFSGAEIIICPKDLISSDSKDVVKRIAYIDDEHPADSYQISNEGKLVTGNNGKDLLYADITELSSYTIPEGIELIKSDAFITYKPMTSWDDCIGLKELTIPASIEKIESDVFYNIYPERVTFEDWENWYYKVSLGNKYSVPYFHGFLGSAEDIPSYVYAGGIRITTPPALKEGMTEIKDYINWGLGEYRDEVELPTTMKRVGAYAFYNNKELSNVYLNEGLEEIGEGAFAECELLESPKFPASLKKIETAAYAYCSSIKEIVLPETLTTLGGGNLIFSGRPEPVGTFSMCTSLEKAVVAVDCDTIPDNFFYGCESLYKVYLPTNLKHYGDYSFYNTALDEIFLPSTLESIGHYAFCGGNLTKLIIPNNVKSIGIGAFSGQSIGNLKLGTGLERIENSTFYGNPLRVVEFSEGLTVIGQFAFSGNQDGLSSVILPSSLTEIRECAFYDTYIGELIIPDNITSLPSQSCGRPAMLTIGSGIKEIAADAFSFDNLITFRLKATMPPTLSDAFPLTNDQNDQLTLVVNQGRKDRYTTNARWKQIDNIIEEESTDVTVYLDGTYTLAEEIRMQSGLMPSRVSKLKVNGPLDGNDLRVIKENMVSLRSLDLSEVTNVTEIPAEQFSNSLLTEIVFPENIRTIGSYAFRNCRLLQLGELPQTLVTIGEEAFSDCPGVTISRIPESVELIGARAFKNCTGIREIISESKSLLFQTDGMPCEEVFAGCSLLERIDLSNSTLIVVGTKMFEGCHELDEILLPETVRMISWGAFSGTAIRDLSFLPQSVENINYNYSGTGTDNDDAAFGNCRRLVSAVLPSKVTHVGPRMFSYCGRLLTVSMPAGVESVGEDIVKGDKKLSNISCAAVEAPEAETGAFDNIRLRYVTLTIPTLSFRSYLNAPQWGKFETIMNRLPIPVSMDGGVEVSNVSEDDYQEMIREDELEAAQEAAAQERDAENSEQLRRRADRRAAARANTRSFASLFDGAQINCGEEGSGTRIFLNPEENVTITSVKFNGEEMLNNLENNSLLLPAGSTGNLEIRTNYIDTGIEAISSDIDFESDYDVYDLNGLLIGHDVDSLNAGIYIVRQKGAVKKISVK